MSGGASTSLDVLREGYGWLEHGQRGREEYDAALSAVEQLVEAAREVGVLWAHPKGNEKSNAELARRAAAFNAALARFDRNQQA